MKEIQGFQLRSNDMTLRGRPYVNEGFADSHRITSAEQRERFR